MGFVSALPASLPVAVFVVMHTPSSAPGLLPRILARHSTMPVASAEDGEPVVPGRILVAPPDFHLLLEPSGVRLSRGPRENRQRPAVDPLFRSAALAFGPAVIGVVLSGTLDDGTGGLLAVKAHGGLTVVQEPSEALFTGMPVNALATGVVDHRLRVAEIGRLIAERALVASEGSLILEALALPAPANQDEELEMAITKNGPSALYHAERPGHSSGFSCPECGGVLFEQLDERQLRFRCRIGHGFTSDGLESEHAGAVESALGIAMRALEEQVAFAERLSERALQAGQTAARSRFTTRAAEARAHAETIRQLLVQLPSPVSVFSADVPTTSGDSGATPLGDSAIIAHHRGAAGSPSGT